MPRETPVEQTNRRQKALTKMPGSLMMPGNDKKLTTPTFPENARDDQGRPDKDNENQAGQPGPVDKQKEKENACDKSTATGTRSATCQLCMARW